MWRFKLYLVDEWVVSQSEREGIKWVGKSNNKFKYEAHTKGGKINYCRLTSTHRAKQNKPKELATRHRANNGGNTSKSCRCIWSRSNFPCHNDKWILDRVACIQFLELLVCFLHSETWRRLLGLNEYFSADSQLHNGSRKHKMVKYAGDVRHGYIKLNNRPWWIEQKSSRDDCVSWLLRGVNAVSSSSLSIISNTRFQILLHRAYFPLSQIILAKMERSNLKTPIWLWWGRREVIGRPEHVW